MYQRMEDQEYKREERKRREIERKQREEQRQREFSLLITALHSLNNIALPQANHVPFYQSTSIDDLMQNNSSGPSQINAMHTNNTTQINTMQINNNTLQIRSPSPLHFHEF
ncbi:hypothetical protein RclHR1_08680010 [Rhizophagus clarus]|uniref:Uncharacterized protein n=1 Tax=Rhizophagus clarus TaxID=94130 RepID=A0A2Z6S828_9GLOM|nr:hypothetical protein RclHR1_08680010 [Rhizophagus clarus]GES80393.1 hypothetical protein RCL_jg22344.t1 [Rhizophagus clarus]